MLHISESSELERALEVTEPPHLTEAEAKLYTMQLYTYLSLSYP